MSLHIKVLLTRTDSEVPDVQEGLQMRKKGSTNIFVNTTEVTDKSKFIIKLIAIAFLGTQGCTMHLFLQNRVSAEKAEPLTSA